MSGSDDCSILTDLQELNCLALRMKAVWYLEASVTSYQ